MDIRNRSDGQGYLGDTALHKAAFWNRDEVTEELIATGANVNARNERGMTPLHTAARYGSLTVARRLLEHGAKLDAKDQDGRTPKDACVGNKSNKNAEAMKRLLDEYRSRK